MANGEKILVFTYYITNSDHKLAFNCLSKTGLFKYFIHFPGTIPKLPLNFTTDLGLFIQKEIIGGFRDTLVNELHVIPRRSHAPDSLQCKAVVTTTTKRKCETQVIKS